jgi:cardiolipin synthase
MGLLLFTVAGLSDGADGYLAKRYGWHSRVGAILDPLADKLLLTLSYLTLTWLSLIPLWLTAAVILRDLLIVAGALSYHLLIGRFELAPSRLSKANTLLQIVLVVAVMLQQTFEPMPGWTITALVYLVLATTVLSGAHYVMVWSRQAIRAGRQRRSAHDVTAREQRYRENVP